MMILLLILPIDFFFGKPEVQNMWPGWIIYISLGIVIRKSLLTMQLPKDHHFVLAL
jgi:hypothetical protein